MANYIINPNNDKMNLVVVNNNEKENFFEWKIS